MATTNMRYDHPQYVTNQVASGVMQLTTINTRNVAFVAYADSIVRAVHWNPLVGGTATAGANVGNLLRTIVRNGTAVAASTSTLIAMGDYGTALTGTSVLHTATLTRGETFRVLNTGTDLTGIWSVGIEYSVIPGASVTS